MKPALRRVPWVRPSPDFHRPSRRVAPKSHARRIAEDVAEGHVTRYLPDTLADRWEAICFRSRFWRAANALGIVLLYAAGLLWAIWLLFGVAR